MLFKRTEYHYTPRCIAFIDILGFREIVKRSILDVSVLRSTCSAIHAIRRPYFDEYLSQSALIIRGGSRKTEPVVTQFSDSLVLSRRVCDIAELVIDVAQAVHILIAHGMTSRGSIVTGQLVHDDQILLGPAMVEAYAIEGFQPYPAIIVPRSIVVQMDESINLEQNDIPRVLKATVEQAKALLAPLTDEYLYVDYFNHFPNLIQYEDGSADRHYRQLRDLIIRGIADAKNIKIRDKYQWMAQQFNQSNVVTLGVHRIV